MLRFAANLSFMFKEHSNLLDRYAAASKAGFKGVECALVYDYSVPEIEEIQRKSGLEQVLINSWPGNVQEQERGLAALPGRQEEFISTLETSIEYAKALNCKRLHLTAGNRMRVVEDAAMDVVYEENIKAAVERLEAENITALIEPINNYTVPLYYMNSFEKALNIIKKIGSPNLKLQLDFFHLQHLRGNITHNIKAMLPFVGHIQIAQVPNRNEPDTPGEINYPYIFKLLVDLGYKEWIGCEYNPLGETVSGLKWITEFGYNL